MNASVQFAVAADCIFDGETLHRHAAVVVDGERIAQIVPRAEAGVPCTALPDGAWLAPGFVDLQVNGGGDVLFNDAPTAESIAAIARGTSPVRHHRFPSDSDHGSSGENHGSDRGGRGDRRASPRCSACISRGHFSRPTDRACMIRR